MIQYLLWSPTRAAFLDAMADYDNPLNQEPLALEVEGELIPSECIRIDEIGEITKDDVVVTGWHVNMVAFGDLEVALTYGMPKTGDVFARTRILSLLSNMEWQPISEIGVPQGWEGPNGTRIFDPAVVATPSRVWA